jgi:hypothetical protein
VAHEADGRPVVARGGAERRAWAGGERPWAADTHATQVLLLDDRARLAFRTTDLPDARDLVELLAGLDRLSSAR